jgi:hypothetical protein
MEKSVLKLRRLTLKKHRVCTTISEKHWGMLKKYAEELDSQQKVLELALEQLGKSPKQAPPLSPEEELWLRIGREVRSACLIQKDGLRELLEMADAERFIDFVVRQRPIEYVLEYFYQKPLRECSLKEVMDGVVINGRISGWYDTIIYSDEDDHYTLKITHDMGLNASKIQGILHESAFKSYGVETESKIAERSIFIKVYKKELENK